MSETLYQFDTVDALTRERHVRCIYAPDERTARAMLGDKWPREWVSGRRVFERRG